MSKRKKEKVYDDAYAGGFLIFILERDRIMKTDLSEVTKSQKAITGTLEFLEKKGYVNITEQTTPRQTFWITLKPEGERIAKLFRSIRDGETSEHGTDYGTPEPNIQTLKKEVKG